MAELKELYQDVRLRVGDVPLPAVIRAARTRARTLCRESYAWVVTETELTLRADQKSFELFSVADGEVLRMEGVDLAGVPLEATSEDQLDARIPGWRTMSGKPQFYFYEHNEQSVRVVPYPRQAIEKTITARYSLRPSRKSTTLGEAFFDEYYETLLAGTLAELLSQKGATWFDSAGAQNQEGIYQYGVVDARSRRERNNTKKTRVTGYGGV